MKRWITMVCVMVCLCGCAQRPPAESGTPDIPQRQYTQVDDVKAIWVSYLELDAAFDGADATVATAFIDAVMNVCKQDGLNTVFWHVRAMGDAYYASQVFPAADSVKGLLSAAFDPLAYAVQAAHQRGIALHAWVNPYRIGTDSSRAVCEDIYEWDGTFYYVPTSAVAQRYILDGVREIVDGYAVDGVQYDDYFYPSGLPDTAQSFETPPASLAVLEWREAAVSGLIAATKTVVHQRTGCLFGVSPAADIARNRKVLYADVAAWMKRGYVDYVCPQIYSGFDHQTHPFMAVADEWAALPRAAGVRLYVGLALYKTGEFDNLAGSGADEWETGGEILAHQARYARGNGYQGVAVFRYNTWKNKGGAVREAEKAALKEVLTK